MSDDAFKLLMLAGFVAIVAMNWLAMRNVKTMVRALIAVIVAAHRRGVYFSPLDIAIVRTADKWVNQ